jgi:hypothetical protein
MGVIWTVKHRDVRKLKRAEMKSMRHTAGYNLLDHKRIYDFLEELEVDAVVKTLAQ